MKAHARMGVWIFLLVWLGARHTSGQIDLAVLRGQRIVDVRVEGSGLPPEEAYRYIEVRPGDLFTIQAVRKSVKLLYYLGLFGQIRVTGRSVQIDTKHEAGQAGIELTFHLIPKRRVLSVEFYGHDVLSTSDLMRLARFRRGEEFDRWRMEATAEDMRALYARYGYRQSRIIAQAEGSPEGDVRVCYYIQEGPPTRLSRIRIEGATAFRTKRLVEKMGLEPGDVLNQKQLDEDLERLRNFYRKHGYLEARLSSLKLDLESQRPWEEVVIEVQAGPKVILRMEGNAVLKTRQLMGVLKDGWEGELTDYTLRDLADRLELKYREHGFARVRVTPRVSLSRMPLIKVLRFVIEEGPRVQVREIRFEGSRAFSNQQLRAYIDNAMIDAISQPLLGQPVDRGDMDPLGGGHPWRGGPRRINRPQGFLFELVPEAIYLREPHEKALDQIVDLYRSKGYVDAVVQTPILSFGDAGANLYITVPIQEGAQTLVESITLEGNQNISAIELIKVADQRPGLVSPGGPLNLYGVEELRKELDRTYAERGYVYCRVRQTVRFSDDRTLAEVRYIIDEGPQVKVGKVIVQGNLVTDRELFDQALSLRAQDVFSPSKVAASKENLLALGVFSGVDIKMMDEDLIEAEKNVLVTVRERYPHAFTLSPGVSSGEGARLELDYTHRNLFGKAFELVGRAKVNYQVFYPLLTDDLRKRYEKLDFLEALEGWVAAGLHWPRLWWLGKNVSARMDLVGLQDRAASYDLTKVSFTPGVDTKLGRDLALTVEFEIGYVRLDCPKDQECGGAAAEKWQRYDRGTMLLAALRPEISWDLRDNILRPQRGVFLSLRTELANNLLQNREVFFFKLDGVASGYLPVGRKGSLALSFRAGSIHQLTEASRTPSHKRFWLGGRNTVRGFPEEGLIPADQVNPANELSPCIPPRNASDDELCISLGGDVYINIKAELRFPLVPDLLEGALFTDLGNLWITPPSLDQLNLRPTAGFGIRLITPIGPVALDFGFNLDPDPRREERSWNIHFNIGVF